VRPLQENIEETLEDTGGGSDFFFRKDRKVSGNKIKIY
jgi:hypothetical protein